MVLAAFSLHIQLNISIIFAYNIQIWICYSIMLIFYSLY